MRWWSWQPHGFVRWRAKRCRNPAKLFLGHTFGSCLIKSFNSSWMPTEWHWYFFLKMMTNFWKLVIRSHIFTSWILWFHHICGDLLLVRCLLVLILWTLIESLKLSVSPLRVLKNCLLSLLHLCNQFLHVDSWLPTGHWQSQTCRTIGYMSVPYFLDVSNQSFFESPKVWFD